jgi:hypothetical protein
VETRRVTSSVTQLVLSSFHHHQSLFWADYLFLPSTTVSPFFGLIILHPSIPNIYDMNRFKAVVVSGETKKRKRKQPEPEAPPFERNGTPTDQGGEPEQGGEQERYVTIKLPIATHPKKKTRETDEEEKQARKAEMTRKKTTRDRLRRKAAYSPE